MWIASDTQSPFCVELRRGTSLDDLSEPAAATMESSFGPNGSAANCHSKAIENADAPDSEGGTPEYDHGCCGIKGSQTNDAAW